MEILGFREKIGADAKKSLGIFIEDPTFAISNQMGRPQLRSKLHLALL